jgi:predicted GNAT family acetyltransferase
LPRKDVVLFFIEQIFFAGFLPLVKSIKKINTQQMVVLHKEDANEGAFYIEEDGERLAEMDYKKEKDRIIIQHTEVDESLRGKNVGFLLVERGVEYARKTNLKIVPLCVFAKKIMDTHKEFQDVL